MFEVDGYYFVGVEFVFVYYVFGWYFLYVGFGGDEEVVVGG